MHITNFIYTMNKVLDCAEYDPKLAMKYIGETAIICRIISIYKPEFKSKLLPIAQRCLIELSRHKRLAYTRQASQWRLLCMPYTCLKHFDLYCPKLEGLLHAMHDVAPRMSERHPYENCEDDYIMAIAGLGQFPQFSNLGWDHDRLNLYSFKTADIYHYTHRYFYATDFGIRASASRHCTAELFLLLAKAVKDKNADLSAELGLCLLGENLNEKDLGVLDAFQEELRPEINAVLSCDNIMESYHPHYVITAYKVFREGFETPQAQPTIMKAYTNLYESLRHKCPDVIQACYDHLHAQSPSAMTLKPCINHRYAELKTLAQHKILFAEESIHLSQDIPHHIYSQYLENPIFDHNNGE